MMFIIGIFLLGPIVLKKSNRRRIPRKPWITSAILRSIHRKEKLHKKYVSNPTNANKQAHVSYRNKLTTLIRISKRHYYAEKLEESKFNSKQTWNVLNDILGRQRGPKHLPSFFFLAQWFSHF